MLTTTVKVSNVTNLSDARYCAGMGVELLGFRIDPDDPQYVSANRFREIRGWVAGIPLVGETRLQDAGEIRQILEQYPLDILEVTVPEMIPYLKKETNIPVALCLDIDHTNPANLSEIVKKFDKDCAYILLESVNNSPMSDIWNKVIKNLPESTNILLGFGFSGSEDILAFLDTLPLGGIALQGSEELRPGFKDFGILMEILEALESE